LVDLSRIFSFLLYTVLSSFICPFVLSIHLLNTVERSFFQLSLFSNIAMSISFDGGLRDRTYNYVLLPFGNWTARCNACCTQHIHRVDYKITCSSCFCDVLRRYLMNKILRAPSDLNVPALDMENVVVLDSF
jgi:hypothetical protein